MLMLAKEFFQRVRRAESELKLLNAKLEHYEELGFPSGGIVSGTGNAHRGASRVELAACGAVDALRDLYDARRDFLAVIARAERVIGLIPQEKYRKLLSYYYILGKSMRWISDELEYKDPNSVYTAKKWALYEAQKVLNMEEQEHDGTGKGRV